MGMHGSLGRSRSRAQDEWESLPQRLHGCALVPAPPAPGCHSVPEEGTASPLTALLDSTREPQGFRCRKEADVATMDSGVCGSEPQVCPGSVLDPKVLLRELH